MSRNQPPYVALYKVYDALDWLPVSIASVQDYVEGVVVVQSRTSWIGERTDAPTVSAGKKGHVIEFDTTCQQKQYLAGLRWIGEHYPPDTIVMVVDSDELWTPQDIFRARQHIDGSRGAWRCRMHTYLKHPQYRVTPAYGWPLVFFHYDAAIQWLPKAPRGKGCPGALLDDVWMHHFTYVRPTYEELDKKIEQTCKEDKEERTPNYRAVWDKLPAGTSLHGCRRWRKVWGWIEVVPVSELPPALQRSELLKRYGDAKYSIQPVV